ncbi:MAG: quinoprotein dehydrogenase-associated putative ABC transporter substrate-binding protein [Chromatiales bacterium]
MMKRAAISNEPLLGLSLITLVLAAMPAMSEEEGASTPTAFKVCADPNSLPDSNQKEEGFENKIAKVFADDLGLPLKYEWFPKARGFIRRTLKNDETPDGSFKCDVVLGVVEGFELADATRPYYHSTWAMVYLKGRGLDDIKTPADLVNLPEEKKKNLRIGLYDRGPATDWAFKHGLFDYLVPYQSMLATNPDEYPGRIIEEDLLQDKINVTFVWGPVAGYYAKKMKDQELVVIPMQSEPGIKFDFRFAMAVRFGEEAWKQQINELIESNKDEIRAILAEYNMPMVSDPLSEPYQPKDDDDDDDRNRTGASGDAAADGKEKTDYE